MKTLPKSLSALPVVIKSREFALSLFAIMFMVIIIAITSQLNVVLIRDEERSIVKYTLSNDVDNILEDNGIITLSNDIVEMSEHDKIYTEINISRAFPVYVTHDGRTQELMVANGSVNDLLDDLDISFDANDIISLPLTNALAENDNIILQRVEYQTESVEEEISFDVESKETSLLPDGKTKTISSGENGVKMLTYVQKTIDGVVNQTQLVSDTVISEPVHKEILVGGSAAVSPLDFGYQMDENNVPIGYTDVITNAIATGYSGGPNAWGASGMDLSYGYVATNPDIIPFGTEMYISSPDNSFVYGYAIAADTGTGLMDGIIDVDLFYETKTESLLSSKRNVNIYILP